MTFDGTSTYASASLATSDCLEDPVLCVNGLSLGAKLYFTEEDMSYDTPRYVVDTGARSAGTQGVSMYILSGNLFCQLSTAEKAWKVCKDNSIVQLLVL